jgi:hypothetical protein
MRALLCLLLLCSFTSVAQEEPAAPEESSDSDSPSMMRPASDSPESAHPRKYDGPKHRVQAFLIPMDEAARGPTTRVAQAIESVLLHTPIYEVVDLGRALSVESTAEQALKADEGRRLVAEGNSAAASKGWPEAAGKYQRALQAFAQGLPAVGAREYADATLRLGAAEWMSGEERAAREAFALAVRLDPRQKLDAHAVEPAIDVPVAAARAEADATRRGFLEIETRPAGARVQVDGESKGQTPVHAELTAGRHLVRVARAGFYPTSELIEIVPRKTAKQSTTLSATPTAASLSRIIAGASDEVGRGTAGKSVASLAEKFSLERVMIGSIRSQEESRVSVVLALVDAPRHKLIGSRTLTLMADGTDADQIELDTGNAARRLIATDDADPDAPADSAAPAAATPAPAAATASAVRRPVIPGAFAAPAPSPAGEEPGLVARERKVAVPAAPAAGKSSESPASDKRAAEPAAPASKDAIKKKQQDEKKKPRSLQSKTGTEGWGDD